MTKEQLIAKAKSMGYKSTPGHNPNYLSKDLGNEWVIDLQWWGKSEKPNVIATHKKLGAGEYVNYGSDHTKLGLQPIDGIVVNKRYARLSEGTSFSLKIVSMALETLENRLK